jgi:hypothetical protein
MIIERVPTPTTDRRIALLNAEAKQIAKSNLIPAAFKKNARDGEVIVDHAGLMLVGLTAAALGVENLSTALAHIHVINGRPCISADLAIGVAVARGALVWRTVETTAQQCIVEGFRPDWPEEWKRTPTRITFTIEDAKRAGLLGKDVWKQYPISMLQARSKKMLAKLLAPEVLTGLTREPLDLDTYVEDLGLVDEAAPTLDRNGRPIIDIEDEPANPTQVIDAEIATTTTSSSAASAGNGPDQWCSQWRRRCGSNTALSGAALALIAPGTALAKDLDLSLRTHADEALTAILRHVSDGRESESLGGLNEPEVDLLDNYLANPERYTLNGHELTEVTE